ncbi:MAG: hypothetical protein AB8B74_07725 [Crocinitomicaceae bacterium]
MKWIIFGLLIGTTGFLNAQNEEDALRYSQESLGGTARNISMAGAMTALGGDYSSTLKNPAASGRFSKNNFSFTTFLENNNTTAEFQERSFAKSSNKLKLGNISYLKAYSLDPKKYNGWAGIQLGMGYNRKQSFNNSFSYGGESNGSIVDYFIAEADNTPPTNSSSLNPFSSGLAYESYVIDPYSTTNDSTDYYYSSGAVGKSNHSRTVTTEGGMGEINFSISGNYKNKLLIGGSFNVVTLNYDSRFSHQEQFKDSATWITQLDYSGYLQAKGSGINARVGLIYIPAEFIRVGASIETPTRISINEQFGNDMTNTTINGTISPENGPPTGANDYIIRTPMRANFSLGLVSKKIGSIGAELELVDYSKTFMKSPSNIGTGFYSYNDENKQIDNLYQSTFNLKFGAEARINKQLYLRGGYAIFGSAYKPEKGVFDKPVQNYTAGIGYNFGSVYLDFATMFSKVGSEHYAYSPELEGSNSLIQNDRKQFILSFGYRF